MDFKYYERKLNDIIMMCPIEAGVEILVYTLLDSLLDSERFSLIDINRLHKESDSRLTTEAGVSDIAVVSRDFRYNSDKGSVYGFVEVKANSQPLVETEQIDGQKSDIRHYLYTNGLSWRYYVDEQLKADICLAYCEDKKCDCISIAKMIDIDKKKFDELKTMLNEINWAE